MAWVRTVVIQGFISMSNVWTPHDLIHTRALDNPEPWAQRWNSRCTAEPATAREIAALLAGAGGGEQLCLHPDVCGSGVGIALGVLGGSPLEKPSCRSVGGAVWFCWCCPALLADCVPIPWACSSCCVPSGHAALGSAELQMFRNMCVSCWRSLHTFCSASIPSESFCFTEIWEKDLRGLAASRAEWNLSWVSWNWLIQANKGCSGGVFCMPCL